MARLPSLNALLNLSFLCTLTLLLPACARHQAASAPLAVDQLRCEYLVNPLGIDTPSPRLNWTLRSDQRAQSQSAYQVRVASTPALLDRDQPDIWDSGKVSSGDSIHIPYQGRPLAGRERCYWKVRVWNQEDHPSPWSPAAWWEMAPQRLDAQWINDGKPTPATEVDLYKEDPAPLFRKRFAIDKPVQRARLYISGLGYYEAFLNSRRVGDHRLDPGWTTYSRRILYSTYDVTDQLRRGDNCLGVMLGNGWYNPLPMRLWGKLNLREHLTVGRPRVIAQLVVDYADGSTITVKTDPTWKVADGPILRNNVYLGEVYDARREIPGWDRPAFDDSSWRAAALATEPLGELRPQMQPPIRITATLKPAKITQPRPGLFIVDMGQNFAGWVSLRGRGPAGTTIKLRYGELLFDDGTLNVLTSTSGQIKPPNVKREAVAPEMAWAASPQFGPGAPALASQGSTFILKGAGTETYTPRFAYHGFRYVEITGYPGIPTPEDIVGLRLNADVQPVGSFECSNPLLNRIQAAVQWTFLSNLFSVQSDCLHREKFGYGGDIVPTADAFLYNYDMAPFYAKVVADLADAARPSGGLTETAPYVGIADQGLAPGTGPIGWMIAHPVLLQKLHQFAGDRRLVEQQYDVSRRLVEFIRSHSPDHLVTAGIGDHESLDPRTVPLTSTAFYYHHARLLAQLAHILGKEEDARRYEELSGQIKAAFIARFLKPGTGRFDSATQANQSFALHYDLVPPQEKDAAFRALLDAVAQHKNHLATGIFGTRFLLDTLTRFGRADLAYAIATQETFPGWGHMLSCGATTLWEHWEYSDNTYSHNHPMFGSISAWFYESLAGIRPAPDAVAFDRILIHPQVPPGLAWVKCVYNSVRGPVESHWRIESGQFQLTVAIPPNATATVYVPGVDPQQVTESGRPAGQAPGVTFVKTEGNAAVYRVASGRYRFTAPRPGQ